ncbi:hypothetical protein X975_01154, partial [Stegodyphus mimosarum]
MLYACTFDLHEDDKDDSREFEGFRTSQTKGEIFQLLDYVKKCGEAVINEDDITEVLHCDDNAPIINQLTDDEICSMVLDPENATSNSEESDREHCCQVSSCCLCYQSNDSRGWSEAGNRNMTEKDPELQDALFHIKNGWPERNKIRPAAQPYWHCKEELYVTKDGIICQGQRLVVPASLREEIMKKLHVSHKELKLLKSITAQTVITVMKSIFATHGIPEELITDGGPPYNSEALRKFLEEWGVMHNITSQHFAGANGLVERSVQTLKKSLNKVAEEGKDLYIVLLDYRIQPAKDLLSPAELLMGRRLRSFLPSHPKALQPKFQIKGVSKALERRQMMQKKYANKHATLLPKLHENDKVWYKRKTKEPWKQVIIMQIGPQPKSYVIKANDGTVYRRNQYHICKDNSMCKTTEWNRTAEDFFGLNQSAQDQPALVDDDKQNPPKEQESDYTKHSQIPGNVPNEPALRRSSRNRIKPLRYRNN